MVALAALVCIDERWRGAQGTSFYIVASALTLAVAAIAIDIYQWRAALRCGSMRKRSRSICATAPWEILPAPLAGTKRAVRLVGSGTYGHGHAGNRGSGAASRAAAFGIATLGVAAWVGRRWMGRIAAVVFVLLCWIGPLLSHYRFEVKHYTADVLFGLLLPVLAAWAIEADRSADRARRVWLWWIAAAIGHWFANGALLVTPACAIFLCWPSGGATADAPRHGSRSVD